MSEWIKCQDRLPEQEGYYFIYINTRRCVAQFLHNGWFTIEYFDEYKGEEIVFDSFKKFSDWTQENTSHWMPLPKPPEEK